MSQNLPNASPRVCTHIKKNREYLPLNIAYFNAQGLYSKYHVLSDFIAENDPDIVVITETWLDKSVDSNEFNPDGYVSFRKDRDLSLYTPGTYKDEKRGGVALLIKEHLKPQDGPDTNCELKWVTINPTANIKWLIGGCYRPEEDEQHMLNEICSSIQNIDAENVTLLGDFNFRSISWDSGDCSSQLAHQFLDCLEDNLLTQVVNSPTRGDNILDLVLVGDPSKVTNCEVGEHFGSSDHRVIHLEISCPVPRINFAPRKIYLYSKGDYESLNQDINDTDWDSLLSSDSPEENWATYKSKYEELVDKYVPTKNVKPGQRHRPAWTRYKSVAKAKSRRRKQNIRAKTSGLTADQILLTYENKRVSATLGRAKSDFEGQLAKDTPQNPKRFWNYTRHFSRSSQTVEVLVENGEEITDDTLKAEILNDNFINVQTIEPDSGLPLPPKNAVPPKFILTDILITPKIVKEKIDKLHSDRASGPDQISVNVLRNCPNFDKPLSILFNQSLRTSFLPQDWRDGNITPLFKKGKRSLKSNYRSVSLTSQIVKLFEK